MRKSNLFLALSFLSLNFVQAQEITIDSVVAPAMFHNNRRETALFKIVKEGLVLKSTQNFFFIYFHSTSQQNEFEYQMMGLETYFIPTNNRFAYYSNIPEGNYWFIVRARSNRPITKKIFITVEGLIWQKWWFSPLVFLFVCSLIGIVFYFFFLYKSRQQLHLLSVRESIARDLHDDMGSYLGSISMLSQSVLNIARKDPEHARLLVDKIGETARQVMDSMSDIVWSVNPENDSMAQVVVRMRDVATDLLGSQDITLHQDIDEAVSYLHLPLEQRRDFFLIYKEALTNIAKYALATHVWVRLQRNASSLVLTIQDDGVGFDTQQAVGQNPLGGNGIKNMHTRVQKLGGTLSIQSIPGQGTSLTLQILVV